MTWSSSASPKSSSSSSSFASSMAKGVRSIKAAALTACSMGIADSLPYSGTFKAHLVGSRLVLIVRVELVLDVKVGELDEPTRLDFDKDLRKVGVSNDS